MQIGSASTSFQTFLPTAPVTRPASTPGAFAAALNGVASPDSAGGVTRPQSSSLIANLTADDRALIQQATGVAINASGFPQGGGLVPELALDIAMDRQAGRLSTGQPITASYLNNMLAGLPTGPISTTESRDIARMLKVLGQRGSQDGFDLRA